MHSPTTGNLQPCTDTNMDAGAPTFTMSSHRYKADCGLVAPATKPSMWPRMVCRYIRSERQPQKSMRHLDQSSTPQSPMQPLHTRKIAVQDRSALHKIPSIFTMELKQIKYLMPLWHCRVLALRRHAGSKKVSRTHPCSIRAA